MSNYKWLLDAGHGGMTADSKYTTAPAKMYVFDDGLTFYEGVNNRKIVDKLLPMLDNAKIEYELVYDQVLDTPLSKRVAKANKIHAKEKRCIYLSIHSDAMPDGKHGKGSGCAIYTSIGQTKSDRVAEIFAVMYDLDSKPIRLRKEVSDGDSDLESNFYVLRETKCPAILIENLFFDNREEAEFLMSEEGQERIAGCWQRRFIAWKKSNQFETHGY